MKVGRSSGRASASGLGPRASAGPRWPVSDGRGGLYPKSCLCARVSVEGFWIDSHSVTVDELTVVRSTGHVTVAERSSGSGPLLERLSFFAGSLGGRLSTDVPRSARLLCVVDVRARSLSERSRQTG